MSRWEYLDAIQMRLYRKADEMKKSKSRGVSMGAPLLAAIAFVIGVLAVVYIVPLAITEAANTTAISGYSSWPSAVQSIWTLMPYIVAFGAVAMVIWVAFAYTKRNGD